jgi:hypothetical protein
VPYAACARLTNTRTGDGKTFPRPPVASCTREPVHVSQIAHGSAVTTSGHQGRATPRARKATDRSTRTIGKPAAASFDSSASTTSTASAAASSVGRFRPADTHTSTANSAKNATNRSPRAEIHDTGVAFAV